MLDDLVLWKLLAFALGKADPKGFDGSTDVVDQLCVGIDQRLARADDGQMGLALFASVLERVQKLRIQACQAS